MEISPPSSVCRPRPWIWRPAKINAIVFYFNAVLVTHVFLRLLGFLGFSLSLGFFSLGLLSFGLSLGFFLKDIR